MVDDDLVLGAIAHLTWVADKAVLADLKPRHIGRVVSFSTEDRCDVMGTLDGKEGGNIIVMSESYDFSTLSDFRIWRKAIEK